MSKGVIFIAGVTGCIGGRLLMKLQSEGRKVRGLARNPGRINTHIGNNVEIISGDLSDKIQLRDNLKGVSTAFYLVHSMQRGPSFEVADREMARNFAWAAREAEVGRIVYLGGLGDTKKPLSAHLRSRHETGEILRNYGCQVVEFRSSIVIGSGSLSFEMIRALVERLPIMVTPRWVRIKTQPIGIEDLLSYLVEVIDMNIKGSPIIEIGGSDIVSYGDLMKEYARQRGLKRFMVPVPVLTPRLSGLWLHLVTPVYARVGRALIDSIQYETIVHNHVESAPFHVKPIGMSEAIQRAISKEDLEQADMEWSDFTGLASRAIRGRWIGNRFVDSRSFIAQVSPEKGFYPISIIGGKNGWYSWNILWILRGFLDRLLGGPGFSKKRTSDQLQVGDDLDFWKVEAFDPPRILRLKAQMKLPGEAWLQFEVIPTENGSRIRQTAIFNPRGVGGLLYWYALLPIHALIFPNLLNKIVARALGDEI